MKKKPKKPITVRMSHELIDRIKKKAKKSTFSKVIIDTLEKGV